MAKKKVDLAAEAAGQGGEVEGYVTRADLLDNCPQDILPFLKKAKTDGQLADLLYDVHQHRLEQQREAAATDKLESLLERYFIQQLPTGSATGIAGKKGRVQLKKKSRPSVIDWPKFYAHIKKNNAFELLNRAVNTKSVSERWEAGKQIPGVEKFEYNSVSVTKV